MPCNAMHGMGSRLVGATGGWRGSKRAVRDSWLTANGQQAHLLQQADWIELPPTRIGPEQRRSRGVDWPARKRGG